MRRAALLTHAPLTVIGGTERFTLYLWEFLKEEGFKVDVYEPPVPKTRLGQLLQPVVQYYYVGRKVARHINDYHLVVTIGFTSGFLRGRNVINVSLGSVQSYANSIKQLYHRRFLVGMYATIIFDRRSKKGKLCIAASSQVETELQRDYGAHSISVPCGIDTRHFSRRGSGKEFKLRYGIKPEATVGLFSGRWDQAHKGLDLLTPIMRDRTDVHWLIATTSDPALKEVRNLTVLRDVSYQELPNVYSAADFSIQLSRYESFGFSFVESLSCGVPVISTPVGVASTLYDDPLLKQLLVPYEGYPEARIRADVNSKIERLKDKRYLDTLAIRGRARVEKEFSLEAWKERMRNVLSSVLEGVHARDDGLITGN